MKIKNAVFVGILSLTMIACSPKYYSPNTQNVPLITEKGETNLTLSGNGNQIEIQGAYGISQSIALKANGGLFIPKDLENGNGGSGKYLEIGGGYYKALSNDLVFETYGLIGFHNSRTTCHLPQVPIPRPRVIYLQVYLGSEFSPILAINQNIFRQHCLPDLLICLTAALRAISFLKTKIKLNT